MFLFLLRNAHPCIAFTQEQGGIRGLCRTFDGKNALA
jgi:hypothetical protein